MQLKPAWPGQTVKCHTRCVSSRASLINPVLGKQTKTSHSKILVPCTNEHLSKKKQIERESSRTTRLGKPTTFSCKPIGTLAVFMRDSQAKRTAERGSDSPRRRPLLLQGGQGVPVTSSTRSLEGKHSCECLSQNRAGDGMLLRQARLMASVGHIVSLSHKGQNSNMSL